jgi:uncharacterized membrane-anchored protein YitT (DUF2179 family)
MALAFELFLVPNRIAPGGVSGLGTILYHLFGIPVGISMLVLNAVLFVFGFREMGKEFGVKSLAAAVLLSIFIDLISLPPVTGDPLLASIYGGVIMGLGLGVVFRAGATTGGTVLFAKMIHRYFHFLSVAWVLFLVDFLVVVFAGFVFGPTMALYALVSLFVGSKAIDLVQEGLNAVKAFIIISDHSEEISLRILKDLDRGVTVLYGKGAYTKNEKNVLLCALNRMQSAKLKAIVSEIDPKAFVLVADVTEAMGEGF